MESMKHCLRSPKQTPGMVQRANAGVYKQTLGMVQRARAGTGVHGGEDEHALGGGGTNERTQGERGGCERAHTNADSSGNGSSGDNMWPPSPSPLPPPFIIMF